MLKSCRNLCGISAFLKTGFFYERRFFDMKKNLFAAAGAMLLLAAWSMTACGGSADVADTSADTAGTAADTVITEAITTEAVTEVVTEAPKRDKIVYVSTYLEDGNRTPISLMGEGTSVAAHIAAEGIVESVAANCPSWSDNVGSLTMKFYAWNTDYETTVAGECLVAETFVDYEDNATLEMDLTDDFAEGGLPAGEYLWVLCDGEDAGKSGVGIWAQGYPEEDAAIKGLFKNGKEYTSGPSFEADFVIRVPAE